MAPDMLLSSHPRCLVALLWRCSVGQDVNRLTAVCDLNQSGKLDICEMYKFVRRLVGRWPSQCSSVLRALVFELACKLKGAQALGITRRNVFRIVWEGVVPGQMHSPTSFFHPSVMASS